MHLNVMGVGKSVGDGMTDPECLAAVGDLRYQRYPGWHEGRLFVRQFRPSERD